MYNHLKVPESWNSYFSKYPQGLTIMEALLDWVGQVDSMIDHINTTDEHIKHLEQNLEEFYLRFDSKLTEQIQNTLQSWIEDGTLEQVISQLIENRMNFPSIQALQTAPNVFKLGTVVELLGYHYAGDGAGHKRIISTTDDGSGVQVGNKWANLLSTNIIAVESFRGETGADKLQNAITFARTSNGLKLTISSEIDLTGHTIIIDYKASDPRVVTDVVGLGGRLIKNDSGPMFSGSIVDDKHSLVGDFNFSNLSFYSEGYDAALFHRTIMRVNVTGCDFRRVRPYAYSVGTQYIQSARFLNNLFTSWKGYLFEFSMAYDLSICENTIEHGDGFMYGAPTNSGCMQKVRVNNNCIEGLGKFTEDIWTISAGACASFEMCGNYFEANPNYFKFRPNIGTYHKAITIRDNYILMTEDQVNLNKVAFYIAGFEDNITSSGNYTSGVLYEIENRGADSNSGKVVSSGDKAGSLYLTDTTKKRFFKVGKPEKINITNTIPAVAGSSFASATIPLDCNASDCVVNVYVGSSLSGNAVSLISTWASGNNLTVTVQNRDTRAQDIIVKVFGVYQST